MTLKEIQEKLNIDLSDFTGYQIEQLSHGFEKGLSAEQVLVYTNCEFDVFQMTEIQEGFLEGLTLEEVKQYTNPDMDWRDMADMKKKLLIKKKL